MGEAELQTSSQQLIVHAALFFYGDAASQDLVYKITNDINTLWNEPAVTVSIRGNLYNVFFEIEGVYEPDLTPEKVYYNDNPRFNFFRIEQYASTNVSFVDGIPGNTGYFKLEDVQNTATTAAHEFGHTLGLDHPKNLDIRGQGAPGIMYPRGTICDAAFQYDPNAQPGAAGGTLNPNFRKVLASDITNLKLQRLLFNNGRAMVGDFTSVYHEKQTAPGA